MSARQLARDVLGFALGAAVGWYLSDAGWRGRVENDAPGSLRWPG